MWLYTDPYIALKVISNSVNKSWKPWVCTDIIKSLPEMYFMILCYFTGYIEENQELNTKVSEKGLHQIQHSMITSWLICIKKLKSTSVSRICLLCAFFFLNIWWKGKGTLKVLQTGPSIFSSVFSGLKLWQKKVSVLQQFSERNTINFLTLIFLKISFRSPQIFFWSKSVSMHNFKIISCSHDFRLLFTINQLIPADRTTDNYSWLPKFWTMVFGRCSLII